MSGLDWSSIISTLATLAAAYAFALPIAWNREANARTAGLRTFPLVAMATCAYALLGTSIFPDTPEAQARVISGLVAGMGFIGGGAILKHRGGVSGTATAASLWNTGAIGVATAYGRYEIALLLAALNLVTLLVLSPLKDEIGGGGK